MSDNNNNMPSVKAKITWMNDDMSAPKKASASVTLANAFQIHGITILILSFEMRKAIYDAVMGAYSQTMALSNQFKASFQSDQKSAESVPSQGNATVEDLPTEVKTDQDDAEDTSEDEAPAPIMGQMM